MKKKILSIIFLAVCICVFGGCSCEHIWTEADCVNAKTCSECQETEGTALGHDWADATCTTAKTCSRCSETEGELLGHTPGEWNEVIDLVACARSRERHCSVCQELTASETVSLSTLIENERFLFTPQQFIDRLTMIATQYSSEFTYEFVSSGVGLQAIANVHGQQSILQFFRADASSLAADEKDVAEVWCISLIDIGESNMDFRLCFIMACDPALGKDEASEADLNLALAYVEAASNGQPFGYYRQNELLYETCYFPEEALGSDFSMNVVNIYASEFK